jgi:cobalamin-dependent methionine synthase I
VTLAEASGVALALALELELELGFGVEVEPALVFDEPAEVAMIAMTTATITTTAMMITMTRWRVKKPGFGVVSGSDIGNSAGLQKGNERQPGRCRFTA